MNSVIRFIAVLFAFASIATAASTKSDVDRDGLPDDFEQALLQKFLPRMQISSAECDESPALFEAGASHPKVLQRNGTLYGQATPSALQAGGPAIELHYYHLWSRDCGRRGHPLDAEHVSVLIRATQLTDPPEFWKAAYWYASAHQDTLCDVSHAVKAALIGAEDQGAQVWISAGKHASFLTDDQCRRSCGADQCDSGHPLRVAMLVNLGEPAALTNGAQWTQSKHWTMAAKMNPDFSEAVVLRLEASDGVMPLNGSLRPVRAVISAGGSSASAVGNGNRHTGAALANAGAATDHSLAVSTNRTARALKKAREKVKGWFGSGE